MSFTGPVEDRLAIRELIDQYNDAVARFDAEAWRETWTEDAEWELMGTVVQGRDSIVKLWQQTMQQLEFVVFQAVPGAVEISGHEATGRVFASEVLQPKGGKRRNVHGRYDDTYAKIGDQWRFRTRRYRVLSEF
jgi:uncharacterized protein (TIGR02246 family)